MTERRTTTNDGLPFGPEDFLDVFENSYVTEDEWEIIRKHWRESYYEDRIAKWDQGPLARPSSLRKSLGQHPGRACNIDNNVDGRSRDHRAD